MAPRSVSPQRLRKTVALLREALTWPVIARSTTPDDDAVLELTDPDGRTHALHLVEWDLATRALGPRRDGSTSETPVWLVTRATSARRARWREQDENFVDLSGAVRLRLPGMFLDRSDLQPIRGDAARASAHSRNPFSDRGSLVVRVLLAERGRTWTTGDLARAAGVSMATVSLVTEALNSAQLVRPRRVGRERAISIDDPVAVLIQWTRRYDWTRNRSVAFAAPVGAPDRFLRRLPGVLGRAAPGQTDGKRPPLTGRRWALTLQAGASLIAPHAKWDAVHIYVDARSVDELLAIGERAGWPASPTGSVVLLSPYYRTSVWHGMSVTQGLPVVSPTQMMVDLWDYPVRGREQAEYLMQSVGWLSDEPLRTRRGRQPNG